MTYKDSNPTFNAGNRNIVNYKDFVQHEPEEEAELKKMKRQFKKADQVNAVNQDHQSKYNKVTHKNDDLVKAEVEDKLDALEEGIFSDRYKDDSFSEEPLNQPKYVYIVIDEDMHSYESILGIYDSFEKAMKCNAYENRGLTPNEKGEAGSLFIYKEELNKELSPKY